MNRILPLFFVATLVMVSTVNFSVKEKINTVENFNAVEDVLIHLGKPATIHYMDSFDDELAAVGEELIKRGKADYKNYKGKRISSYFNCTDCHSLTKETKEVNQNSAEKRMEYTIKNDKPYYPGSTLHGLYNRTQFYNGDYHKKYGELVVNARDSIENAIQLCAEYCASGRPLEKWEMKAMLHYFKREELKIHELNFTNEELKSLQQSVENKEESLDMIQKIKSKYIEYYPATFTGTMPENKRSYGKNGNPERGEKIYEYSCVFCHGNARVTYLDLSKDVLSARYLWNNKDGYDELSIYQVIRWGTSPKTGRKQYMPLYTQERMTDEQLEDLMAYIKELAGK